MRALLAIVVALSSSAAWAKPRPLTAADVDRQLAAAWHKQHLAAGPIVDDATFLRRVTIDLAGTIPSADAVRAFLADKRPDKRARAVDALLESPAYAQHWAYYWDRALMGRLPRNTPQLDHAGFVKWLDQQFAKNQPWNGVVQALVSSSGVNTESPPVNWILRYAGQPTDLTGKLSRLFLGVQIQCAQCHDHPSEKWKQDDFRALAACFAHTGPVPLDPKQQKGPKQPSTRRIELRDQPGPTFGGGPKNKVASDLRQIALAEPKALDGTDFAHAANRRTALAEWIIKPDNPYFARATVNRYWAHFVGRGFVDPVDDFRKSNPPAAPEVLDALAADFVANDYDLRHLIRLICATRAYQLAVVGGRPGEADERLFVHHRMRLLSGEELYNALAAATGLENALQRAGLPNVDQIKLQIQGAFDFLFSTDEEAPPPADFAGSIQQALLFMNGRLVNRASAAIPGLALGGILDFPADDALKVEALYLKTLSRRPTPAESKRWVAYVSQRKKEAYEDLFWALLNSSEFIFQH